MSWTEIVSKEFSFSPEEDQKQNKIEEIKNIEILQKKETRSFSSCSFFLTREFSLDDVGFYRYESEQEVLDNWEKYKSEMTDSYKRKQKQADRYIKKMKKYN